MLEKTSVIGDSYEDMLVQFATYSGKQAGDFFTPLMVAALLSRLVKPEENDRIYDPTCGSGSLLIKAFNKVSNGNAQIYGQEKNKQTYSLCKMNMFLHGIDDAKIENGDTLANPLHLKNGKLMKFQTIRKIKEEIQSSQYKAINVVNKELILLYWNIGNVILKNSEWGSKFIDNLAKDIKMEFPTLKGFSVRNLKYMRKFAELYTDFEFVQTLSAQITWSHNIEIMDKVKSQGERKWYIEKTIENGWSLNILANQIKTNLYKRHVLVEKTTNYEKNLSEIQSKLADGILKDPYNFDFITFREDMLEVQLEKELVKQVTKLLLELGSGFAFVGNQYHLEVAGEDFYIDLLFYHLKLKCYVVIELKTGKFVPEYAGKLNFYLSAVDDILKTEQDNPTIGLLLCREKNKLIAEYALKDLTKPIGVSEYKLFGELPEEFEDTLPTIEDLESRINCFEGEICED